MNLMRVWPAALVALGGCVAGLVASSLTAGAKEPAPPLLVKVAELKMLHPRVGAAVVAKDDYLYIIGGSDGHGRAVSAGRAMQRRHPEDALMRTRDPGIEWPQYPTVIERLDLRTGVSTRFATLRRPRVAHRAVAVDGKAYILGGYSPEERDDLLEKSVEILDFETGEITSGPGDMPDPRLSFGCVHLQGAIYVIGGQRLRGQDVENTNTVQVLDLPSGQWSDGLPMPTPRQCEAVVVDGGFIVALGGYNGKRALTAVEVFDPRNQAWRTLPALSRVTSGHSAVFLGHQIFLFGDYQETMSVLAYDLFQKTSQVSRLGDIIGRHTAAVVHRNRLYVVGGKDPGAADAMSRILVYELASAGG